MQRIYDKVLEEHVLHYRQMAFIAGLRQVEKTTTARNFSTKAEKTAYLNLDVLEHRQPVQQGAEAIAEECSFNRLSAEKATVIFDEIHKYSKWKLLLKGFFDLYSDKAHIIVTGSGRLGMVNTGWLPDLGVIEKEDRFFLFLLLRPNPFNLLSLRK